MVSAPTQRTQNSPYNMYSRLTCSRNAKKRDTGKELRQSERDNDEMRSHISQIGLAVTSSRCEECPFIWQSSQRSVFTCLCQNLFLRGMKQSFFHKKPLYGLRQSPKPDLKGSIELFSLVFCNV